MYQQGIGTRTTRELSTVSVLQATRRALIGGRLTTTGEGKGEGVLVPHTSLRRRLINLAHRSHPGIVLTKQRLRQRFWWPRMNIEVGACIKECQTRQTTDKTAVTAMPPLQPLTFPSGAGKHLGIYVVGSLYRLPPNFRFAITLVDYSAWQEVAFCTLVTAERVCDFLTIFSREEYPDVILSDQGSQFLSRTFLEFLNSRRISHYRSAIYHPQAKGQAERFNRVLKGYVQIIIQEQSNIRASVTEFFFPLFFPAELLHERRMRTRLDIVGLPSFERPVHIEILQLRQRIADCQ